MDQDETWQGGRTWPRPHCTRRGHNCPSHKIGAQYSPLFGPCLLWPNGWMDQDATWYGGMARPWRRCVRWGPSPPHKGAQQPSLFGPWLLWANGLPFENVLNSCPIDFWTGLAAVQRYCAACDPTQNAIQIYRYFYFFYSVSECFHTFACFTSGLREHLCTDRAQVSSDLLTALLLYDVCHAGRKCTRSTETVNSILAVYTLDYTHNAWPVVKKAKRKRFRCHFNENQIKSNLLNNKALKAADMLLKR